MLSKCAISLLCLIAIAAFHHPQVIAVDEERYLGAFFYPSYGRNYGWNASGYDPPMTWASHYLPDLMSAGFNPSIQLYDSGDEEIIGRQISLMKRATLDFVIASWRGYGSYEDETLKKIFKVIGKNSSLKTPKWCILYEKEKLGDPSLNEILDDLQYIGEEFGNSEAYFRLNGKFVIFVMADQDDGIAYAEKWKEARDRMHNFYVLLKVFPGFIHVKEYADSWFQYAPSNRFECHEGFAAYASPGYWEYDDEPRLERDPSEFAKALMRLYYAPVKFLLIETWNNWLEGSQVEPAYQVVSRGDRYVQASISYGTTYIDLIRKILREEESLTLQLPTFHLILGAASSLIVGILIIASIVKIFVSEKVRPHGSRINDS